jgi:phosphoribosylaminoimidazolecarboxamide formyltransferase/IMP cyclohydrolase
VQGLAAAGYELVSTGGSAKTIEGAGVAVRNVEDLTGFPEMLDGELFWWEICKGFCGKPCSGLR